MADERVNHIILYIACLTLKTLGVHPDSAVGRKWRTIMSTPTVLLSMVVRGGGWSTGIGALLGAGYGIALFTTMTRLFFFPCAMSISTALSRPYAPRCTEW
jgi:hypothetical protein